MQAKAKALAAQSAALMTPRMLKRKVCVVSTVLTC